MIWDCPASELNNCWSTTMNTKRPLDAFCFYESTRGCFASSILKRLNKICKILSRAVVFVFVRCECDEVGICCLESLGWQSWNFRGSWLNCGKLHIGQTYVLGHLTLAFSQHICMCICAYMCIYACLYTSVNMFL